MRFAHLSDLHVTDGPRLQDHAATLASIVDDAIAASPDLWLLTGDHYGKTVPHRSTPAERAVLYPQVVRMAKTAPVVAIIGNHDLDQDLEALEHLGGDWPIRVCKVAEVLAVDTRAGRANLYALPYPTKRWLLAGEEAPRGLVEAQAMVGDKLATLLQLWSHRIRRRRTEAPDEPHVLLAHLQVAGSSTSGGEVLAGQEIELTRAQLEDLPIDYGALGHLHLRQEPALRCWYAGSTWRNDYGETDPKGWNLVETGEGGHHWTSAFEPEHRVYTNDADRRNEGWRQPLRVARIPSRCRDFRTLDYRWAADHEEGTPRWITAPSDAAVIACKDAEVRMRLIVPEQWVAGCPWAEEVERIRAAGAHRIQEERRIEPVLRVRAPEVAAAATLPEKVAAYWRTTGTPPDLLEAAAALGNLEELRTLDDTGVGAATDAVVR